MILFINTKDTHCGVADYGRRVYNILRKGGMEIELSEVDKVFYPENVPPIYDTFLYNFHYATMPWLTDEFLRPFRHIKQACIFHEAHLDWTPDVILTTDIRPLFEGFVGQPSPQYYEAIPVIGSFGFGFPDKNFKRIAEEVAAQYDRAILRLNIPFAKYGDADGYHAKQRAEEVSKFLVDYPGIEVKITHDYLDHAGLLNFLSGNDLNLFLYQPSRNRGLASATDYALSVRRPIGVSNSEMFRHLPASCCIDNTPLRELSTLQLLPVYAANTNAKLVEYYRRMLLPEYERKDYVGYIPTKPVI